MAFRWSADDGPTSSAGLVQCSFVIFSVDPGQYAEKPYIFVIFRLYPHMDSRLSFETKISFQYRKHIRYYRNEILFFGFYRCVNSGESLTN